MHLLYGKSYSLCSPQIINAYTEAVQTVDVGQAVGKPHTLWVQFAKFYEDNEQLPEVYKQPARLSIMIPS